MRQETIRQATFVERGVDLAARCFDPIAHWWESEDVQKKVSTLLVLIFLAGLVGIELARRELLPPGLSAIAPRSHYHAINLAFGLVLVLEVIGLIFALPGSVSQSVGKQYEILSLILLRNSFKELAAFPEPIDIAALGGNLAPVYHILADGAGALFIFVALGLYYRMQQTRTAIRGGEHAKSRFVAAKKAVALGLLLIFFFVGARSAWAFVNDPASHGIAGTAHHFFEVFYTVLVFTDILMVLISQRYLPKYHAVFRNSGYALATLLIRLALSSPPYLDALLGAASVTFSLALAWAYTTFAPSLYEAKDE